MDEIGAGACRPDIGAPALEAAGFSFAYPGCAPVLCDVDWSVPAGAFMLLVGATGCGKTTLLRSFKPEIAPVGERDGSLAVFGEPLERWEPLASAAGIGYVAQSPENQIVCDVVWHELAFGLENLGVAQDVMRRRVAEVAHFFGIEPWMRRATAELSGGQKQMVTLAAVLALRPKLLLLDEPTAQLDPVAEKNFLHALFRINRELGITVVVATHAPESMVDYATGCSRLGAHGIESVSLDEFREPALDGRPAFDTRAADVESGVTDRSARVDAKRVASDRFARAGAPAVKAKDVFYRYAREADWVLRGCNLAVCPGAVHAIVGGNGSGKSTLLRLVAGVLEPERGKVSNAFSAAQALLPQDPKALFVCDTVHGELHEWQARCGYDDDAVCRIADAFGLSGFAMRHPYDLSGGQQQKLALAKVLLTDPELLLLDEPTKGLDAPSKCEVADALCGLAALGKTIVLVTHDLAFASQVADTVTMLFDGEDACTEPTEAFFAGNLFYRPAFDGFMRLRRERARSENPMTRGFTGDAASFESACGQGVDGR